MAVKICLADIRLSKDRALIILCNDFLAVRIMKDIFFAPAIAGITDCKMRSHLLYDQNRQFIYHVIFICKYICGRICSDCKLSDRQCLPSAQKIVLYKFDIIFFSVKVLAGIGSDLSIFKGQLEIDIFQIIQIDLTYI